MRRFTLTRAVQAPAAVVFATISDHRAYPDFTPIRRAELERDGEAAANGLGAIRALYLAGPPIREEVIDYSEPERFSYRVLSGVPVRSQVGTVTIEPGADSGCVIRYSVEVEPLPLSGPATVFAMKVALGRLMAGVEREAERRAAADG